MTETQTPASKAPAAAAGLAAGTPERLLRLPEVMKRVGLRRTAIYQRMREGRFPQARSLGPRCTVWVESEIVAWVEMVRKS